MNLLILLLWGFIMYLLFKSVAEKTGNAPIKALTMTPEQARYNQLINRICTLSKMKRDVELFYFICKEMGFGYEKSAIDRHFLHYMQTNELPVYMWSFLDREQDKINRAWEVLKLGDRS